MLVEASVVCTHGSQVKADILTFLLVFAMVVVTSGSPSRSAYGLNMELVKTHTLQKIVPNAFHVS